MKATLAGGCFWCLEAVYQKIKGISNIKPGYIKGSKETANYDLVCSGKTEHVEAIQFDYDEEIISYDKILDIYFQIHDPTSFQKQGNDVGKQYEAIIFFHSDSQKQIAKAFLDKVKSSYNQKIYTKIEKVTDFFEAEDYHFNYYVNNKLNPYCVFVIRPKLNKVKNHFE